MSCPFNTCNDQNCPQKANCLSEKRLIDGRNTQTSRLVSSQRREDEAQEIKGVYLGYDRETEEEIIQTPSGLVRAKSISNSSPLTGEIVSVVIASGKAIVDRMPR